MAAGWRLAGYKLAVGWRLAAGWREASGPKLCEKDDMDNLIGPNYGTSGHTNYSKEPNFKGNVVTL